MVALRDIRCMDVPDGPEAVLWWSAITNTPWDAHTSHYPADIALIDGVSVTVARGFMRDELTTTLRQVLGCELVELEVTRDDEGEWILNVREHGRDGRRWWCRQRTATASAVATVLALVVGGHERLVLEEVEPELWH